MSDEVSKHIHDLANAFSIIDASLSRSIGLLTKGHPELTEEISRLNKTDEYVKKSIQILNALREAVKAQKSE